MEETEEETLGQEAVDVETDQVKADLSTMEAASNLMNLSGGSGVSDHFNESFDPYQPSSNDNSVVGRSVTVADSSFLPAVSETWPNSGVDPNDIILDQSLQQSQQLLQLLQRQQQPPPPPLQQQLLLKQQAPLQQQPPLQQQQLLQQRPPLQQQLPLQQQQHQQPPLQQQYPPQPPRPMQHRLALREKPKSTKTKGKVTVTQPKNKKRRGRPTTTRKTAGPLAYAEKVEDRRSTFSKRRCTMYKACDALHVRTKYSIEIKMFSKDNQKIYTYRSIDLDNDAEFFSKNIDGYDEELYDRNNAGKLIAEGAATDDDDEQQQQISPSNSPRRNVTSSSEKENFPPESQIDFVSHKDDSKDTKTTAATSSGASGDRKKYKKYDSKVCQGQCGVKFGSKKDINWRKSDPRQYEWVTCSRKNCDSDYWGHVKCLNTSRSAVFYCPWHAK